jgi:cerevisin
MRHERSLQYNLTHLDSQKKMAVKHLFTLFVVASSLVASVVSTVSYAAHSPEKNERFLVLLKPHANLAFHAEFVENLAFVGGSSDQRKEDDGESVRWFSFLDEAGDVVHGYSAAMDGMSMAVLSRSKDVDCIEIDSPVHIMQTNAVQHNAPWGLVRSSHRTMTKERDFIYEENDGTNVDVYIVDTGVYVDHTDFGKRASFGKSFVKDTHTGEEVRIDDNGHGTHCAGTIAGERFGMCKQCHVIGVKVLDANGSGALSDVIAGIGWSVSQALRTKRTSIISMSLGGGHSAILNKAADGAVTAGVYLVAAAGNSRDDSCQYSPASAKKVISVGAIDSSDKMAIFSNYGNCTHIYAPGVQIESTWIISENSTAILDGTSMATPHVAGALGELLSRDKYKDHTPYEMKQVIQKLATKDLITGLPDDLDNENLILYNGVRDDPSYEKLMFLSDKLRHWFFYRGNYKTWKLLGR